MAVSLANLSVIEDCVTIVKDPATGNMVIILPTCSAVKYAQGVTLKQKLDDLEARIEALENGNSLTWNGVPSQSQSSQE